MKTLKTIALALLLIPALGFSQINNTLKLIETNIDGYYESVQSIEDGEVRFLPLERIKIKTKKMGVVLYFPHESVSKEDLLSGNITKWRKETWKAFSKVREGDLNTGVTTMEFRNKKHPGVVLTEEFFWKNWDTALTFTNQENGTYIYYRYAWGVKNFIYKTFDSEEQFKTEYIGDDY